MRKRICIILILSLLLSLWGCKSKANKPTDPATKPTESRPTEPTSPTSPAGPSNPTEPSGPIGPTKPSEPSQSAPLVTVSVPIITENTTAQNGTILFQYTHQTMSLVLPDPTVADKIIVNFLNRVDSTRSLAESTAQMAKSVYSGNGSWKPYMCHVAYSPTRIDSTVLSLFGDCVVYNGAFHPDRSCVSANYDLRTGDVLTLANILSKDAKLEDLCNLVLERLVVMSEDDYYYPGYAQTVRQRFTADPNADESWYLTQTGLCFYFAPYEIAPYASGIISVEIPYSKLTNLLSITYLPTEREQQKGELTLSAFNKVNLGQFNQISEILADLNGSMHILHTDATVHDVRIMQTDSASTFTVFAAYQLTSSGAVMLQASSDTLKNMQIVYASNGKTVTMPLG